MTPWELVPVDAIARRIAYGGDRFYEAVEVGAEVLASLWKLVDLAPLHQAKSLAAMEAVKRLRPDSSTIACLDSGLGRQL